MAGRPSGPDRTAFALRIDPKLLEAVKQCASAELRSVNAQIEILIREALAKRGVLGKNRTGSSSAPDD
jgi:hypothetical protein